MERLWFGSDPERVWSEFREGFGVMKGLRKGEEKQMDEGDMACLQLIIMTLGWGTAKNHFKNPVMLRLLSTEDRRSGRCLAYSWSLWHWGEVHVLPNIIMTLGWGTCTAKYYFDNPVILRLLSTEDSKRVTNNRLLNLILICISLNIPSDKLLEITA